MKTLFDTQERKGYKLWSTIFLSSGSVDVYWGICDNLQLESDVWIQFATDSSSYGRSDVIRGVAIYVSEIVNTVACRHLMNLSQSFPFFILCVRIIGMKN